MPETTSEFESFATVADLERRWKTLESDEKMRAETVLMDASALIASLCLDSGIKLPTADEPDQLLTLNLTAVCCDVVKRSMTIPQDRAGAKSAQQMAGNYMEMYTYDNPVGDLYLTSSEKKRLGIGRRRISSVSMIGGG